MWAGKRVLVTGAGGFIGSHLTEKLVGLGADVRAFVHYNALGNWGWLDESSTAARCSVIAGDVTDRDSVREAARDCKVVFHLAALIAIPYSYRAPAAYLRTNVEGTLQVLHAVRELGIERLVHTSTSEVYGTAQRVPIDEEHPLQGQSPYSASKIGADMMVEAFSRSYDVPAVTVRPFNTFGPRQSARAVIPSIIAQLLSGSSVRLGSLHPTRDLNFVGNTVNGFILAGSTPDAIGRTVNLGSGREISVESMARLIAEIAGVPIEIECDDHRKRPEASEVERLVADSSLARECLGWYPEISLEEGLLQTIDWMRQRTRRQRDIDYAV
jgi:NAD dependent epimerase/dehydratase